MGYNSVTDIIGLFSFV